MRKYLITSLLALALFAPSVAKAGCSPIGVIVQPKQTIGHTFSNENTSVGLSLRVAQFGPVNVSPVALYNDEYGVRFGAFAGVKLGGSTEIGAGSIYSEGHFYKPALALTFRL